MGALTALADRISPQALVLIARTLQALSAVVFFIMTGILISNISKFVPKGVSDSAEGSLSGS